MPANLNDIQRQDTKDTKQTPADPGDNTFLSGEDSNNELLSHPGKEFKRKQGIDLVKDPIERQRAKAEEKLTIEFSSSTQTNIPLPHVTMDALGPKHMNRKLSMR